MWIVTQHGFFNIIEYPNDDGLLTIKARSRKDLEWVKSQIKTSAIEESDKADYRFRVKAPFVAVSQLIHTICANINYSKTKDALFKANPKRSEIYFCVWDILSAIQDLKE